MQQSYRLIRNALVDPQEIIISKSDYDDIKSARDVLTSVLVLESNFYISSESYREFVDSWHQYLNRNLTYSIRLENEDFEAQSEIDRRIISFLSCCRLYEDSTPGNCRKITKSRSSVDYVKNLFQSAEKSNFFVRFMSEIRNFSQHRSAPISTAGIGFSRSMDTGKVVIFGSANFTADSMDNRFDPEIREEILQIGSPVDLIEGAKQYFNEVCKIHSEVRSHVSICKDEAVNLMNHWISEWHKKFGVDLSAVEACKFNGDYLDKGCRTIPLKIHWDDYRVFLENKTGLLNHFAMRSIRPI
ncbi:MAG: hypothetical protein ACRCTD_14525 [Beijerinckiaceae bacterium]